MKTQFTPIAMRFNEENWESIKDKIEAAGIGHNIWVDSRQCYLTNYWSESKETGIPFIGNHSAEHSNIDIVDKVYETWDEAIFLRACGIDPEVYTVPKEFILEAHKDACSTWKSKIEAQFPELFPKLEVGNWYTPLNEYDGIALVCVQNPNNTNNFGYGFDFLGNWIDKGYIVSKGQKTRLATDEEVETALIAEAKRRGFKNGFNIVDLYNGKRKGDYVLISSDDFDYEKVPCGKLQGKMALRDSDGNILFVDGKWAEIISEPIEVTLEQIAEKFNVNIEQLKIKK